MFNQPFNISCGKERFFLLTGLAAGCLGCVFLAWLPLSVSLSHFVFEDASYYLRVARSIIQGHGSSFDGIHPTNGYHPLWMLISIILQLPFKPGAETPVHLLLMLCAVFHVLTAFMIYRVVSLGGHGPAAVIASFLWLFNYNIAGIAMCGLETSLFAFLMISTVLFYVVRRRRMSAMTSLLTGVLLGLTTLARFDGALLGFFFMADQFIIALRKKERIGRMSARIAPMAAAGSLMMVPWMALSLRVSGTVFPGSHRALRLWMGSGDRFSEGILHGSWRIFSTYLPDMGRIYGLVPISLFAFLVIAVFCFVLLWGSQKRKVGLPIVVFAIYPLFHIFYYASFFVLLNRYLYPAHLLIFTGVMTSLGCWLVANRCQRATRLAGIAACAIVATNMLWSGANDWRHGAAAAKTHSLHWTMYTKAVPWIREHVRPDERVGAFNCGIFSYFSGRTIVNLDGVMNDDVIPALEQRRLFQYLRDEQIVYLVDWEGQIAAALTLFGGFPDYQKEFKVIQSFEQPWGPYKGSRLLVLRLLN